MLSKGFLSSSRSLTMTAVDGSEACLTIWLLRWVGSIMGWGRPWGSGMVGDSPIIGAGLFVDNEVGACTATGQGEDVIRVAGSHSVVELMRQGLSPEMACKKVIERIIRIKGPKAKDIQVGFLAINKKGQVGAWSIHKGFEYAIRNQGEERLVKAKFVME